MRVGMEVPSGERNEKCVVRLHSRLTLGPIALNDGATSSISTMRPPCYSLLEEIVILGVIYGSLVWRVCNPAGGVEVKPGTAEAAGASLV